MPLVLSLSRASATEVPFALRAEGITQGTHKDEVTTTQYFTNVVQLTAFVARTRVYTPQLPAVTGGLPRT